LYQSSKLLPQFEEPSSASKKESEKEAKEFEKMLQKELKDNEKRYSVQTPASTPYPFASILS